MSVVPPFALKDGVSTLGMHPRWFDVARLYYAIRKVAGIEVTAIITSAFRPATDRLSFHPVGEAIDLRCKDIPPHLRSRVFASFYAALKKLDFFYEPLWEDDGSPNEHFHVEYDDPNGTRPVVREKAK
jgi:hypothetical protein